MAVAGRDLLRRQVRVRVGRGQAGGGERLRGVRLGAELRRLLEHRRARGAAVLGELDLDELLPGRRLLHVARTRRSPARWATATAVPSDGCPAIGSSRRVSKMRLR